MSSQQLKLFPCVAVRAPTEREPWQRIRCRTSQLSTTPVTMVGAVLGELGQPAWGRQGCLGLFKIKFKSEHCHRKDKGVGSVGISGVNSEFCSVPSFPGVSAGGWMCLCPLPFPSACAWHFHAQSLSPSSKTNPKPACPPLRAENPQGLSQRSFLDFLKEAQFHFMSDQ